VTPFLGQKKKEKKRGVESGGRFSLSLSIFFLDAEIEKKKKEMPFLKGFILHVTKNSFFQISFCTQQNREFSHGTKRNKWAILLEKEKLILILLGKWRANEQFSLRKRINDSFSMYKMRNNEQFSLGKRISSLFSMYKMRNSPWERESHPYSPCTKWEILLEKENLKSHSPRTKWESMSISPWAREVSNLILHCTNLILHVQNEKLKSYSPWERETHLFSPLYEMRNNEQFSLRKRNSSSFSLRKRNSSFFSVQNEKFSLRKRISNLILHVQNEKQMSYSPWERESHPHSPRTKWETMGYSPWERESMTHSSCTKWETKEQFSLGKRNLILILHVQNEKSMRNSPWERESHPHSSLENGEKMSYSPWERETHLFSPLYEMRINELFSLGKRINGSFSMYEMRNNGLFSLGKRINGSFFLYKSHCPLYK